MVDLITKLLDRLIQLRTYQIGRTRRIFDQVIDPLMRDLTQIHKDHLEMFEDVRAILRDNDVHNEDHATKLMKAILVLRERRVEYEPVRVKAIAIGCVRGSL
jgi:hypothetical protein